MPYFITNKILLILWKHDNIRFHKLLYQCVTNSMNKKILLKNRSQTKAKVVKHHCRTLEVPFLQLHLDIQRLMIESFKFSNFINLLCFIRKGMETVAATSNHLHLPQKLQVPPNNQLLLQNPMSHQRKIENFHQPKIKS